MEKSKKFKPKKLDFIEPGKAPAKIYSEYLRILDKELDMRHAPVPHGFMPKLHDPEYFLRVAQRIIDVAENSNILRCRSGMGHLTTDVEAYESDGSHTNLVSATTDAALDFEYGWGIDPPNYTRKEFGESVRLHDLPENVSGDMPNNNSAIVPKKNRIEGEYYDKAVRCYYDPYEVGESIVHMRRLLAELAALGEAVKNYTDYTPESRIFYGADKLAAIIDTLNGDRRGDLPHAGYNDPDITDINHKEMDLCELRHPKYGDYLLSEIWTVDFLYARELTRYDDTGFFTGLLIMTTLLCHKGKWYHWRENQYLENA